MAVCAIIYSLNGFSNRPLVFFLGSLHLGGVVMKKMQKSLLLVLGLLCLLLASCVDSDNPLSDPKQAAVDPGLLGVWRVKEKDGEVTYYHVGQAGKNFPAGMLRVKAIKHEENSVLPHPDNSDLLAFSTTLGNNHYLNVTGLGADQIETMGDSPWEPTMADGYFLFKYEIHADKLTIAGMDAQQKKAAIKAGKIKGTTEDNKVLITDTTDNLARFIAAADQDKLFPTKEASGESIPMLERVK